MGDKPCVRGAETPGGVLSDTLPPGWPAGSLRRGQGYPLAPVSDTDPRMRSDLSPNPVGQSPLAGPTGRQPGAAGPPGQTGRHPRVRVSDSGGPPRGVTEPGDVVGAPPRRDLCSSDRARKSGIAWKHHSDASRMSQGRLGNAGRMPRGRAESCRRRGRKSFVERRLLGNITHFEVRSAPGCVVVS